MKISIGTKIKDGPWGGGNLFAINLSNYLSEKGHEVSYDLSDNNLDIILITEPRRTSESSAFSYEDVRKYLSFEKKDALVVHRINECDERKQTNYVNKYMIQASKVADATVFVSDWLKSIYVKQNIQSKNISTIMAGANSEIFNPGNLNIDKWSSKNKIKIVTHHWGANWNKGFNIYSRIDSMLNNKTWRKKIEFNYIGNVPKNYDFKNTNVISPLSGVELANKIKENHIYLTASLNEPSGNHHIEGAQCGLPILFINSGGIPEYCEGFGVMFDEDNFEGSLNELINNYEYYFNKVKTYPHNSQIMCDNYLELFKTLMTNKEKVISERDSKIYEKSNMVKLLHNLNKKIKGN